jgi:hypothetical protein
MPDDEFDALKAKVRGRANELGAASASAALWAKGEARLHVL